MSGEADDRNSISSKNRSNLDANGLGHPDNDRDCRSFLKTACILTNTRYAHPKAAIIFAHEVHSNVLKNTFISLECEGIIPGDATDSVCRLAKYLLGFLKCFWAFHLQKYTL